MKRKTSLKYSINNKKEKNNEKFQSYRSHAASEHLLIITFTSCQDDVIDNGKSTPAPEGAKKALLEAYGLTFENFVTANDVQILNNDTTEISVNKALAEKLGITSFVNHPMGIWDAKNHLPYARKATAEKLLGDRYILTVQPATIAEILGDKKVTLNTSIYVNQNVTGDQTRAGLDMPSYAAKFMDEDNVIHPAVIHVAFYEALDQAMKFPEVEKAKRLDPNNLQRVVDNIHEIAIKKYGDKSSADYRYVELVRRYIVVHFQQTCGSRYTNFK